MSLTRQWLETKPASTDKIKDGPAEFQARWKDVRELLSSGGHVCDGASPLDEQGRHAVNASGIASPDIYKADRQTKILAWADASATLLADYKLNGSKNIPEATLDDSSIGIDVKAYQRVVSSFRITESNPVDTKVNIGQGVYFVGAQGLRSIGGQLTIGTAPLTLPSAGNKAQYAIVVNSLGNLNARKGTEVAFAGSTASPDVEVGDNLIGYIEIRADSVSFSMAASGVNAFFVRDGRAVIQRPAIAVLSRAQTLSNVTGTVLRQSKSVTVNGQAVLVIGRATDTDPGKFSIGRTGTTLDSAEPEAKGGTEPHTLVALDVPGSGIFTYELRSDNALAHSILMVIVLPVSAIL